MLPGGVRGEGMGMCLRIMEGSVREMFAKLVRGSVLYDGTHG